MIHKPGPRYRSVEDYRAEVAERLYLSHQHARQNSEEEAYYNLRAKKRDFRVGDTVYVTNEMKKSKRKGEQNV